MSFNENDTISLSNYEEWFILYMDGELTADQKTVVESFVLLHPPLQEELDLLLSTKLPAEKIVFSGKAALQADAMKLNTVDESLLLYIDNELPAAERKAVEERMAMSNDVRQQYDLLQSTKLDAAEVIPYPNKKELYRHAERVILFPAWMRIAVAVVVLLFGSYLFLINPDRKPATPDTVAVQNAPAIPGKLSAPINQKPVETTVAGGSKTDAVISHTEEDVTANAGKYKRENRTEIKKLQALPVTENTPDQLAAIEPQKDAVAIQQAGAVKVDLSKLNVQSLPAVNNSVANLPVTSATVASFNILETPEGAAVTEGEPKRRTSAKGFLRKVSRFIERRTGIGTVNADNELLIGAVALKLN